MTADPPRGGPGYRRLTAHPDYEAMRQRTLAEQQRAISEVQHKRTATKPDTGDYPAPTGVAPNGRNRRSRKDRA